MLMKLCGDVCEDNVFEKIKVFFVVEKSLIESIQIWLFSETLLCTVHAFKSLDILNSPSKLKILLFHCSFLFATLFYSNKKRWTSI